MENNNMTFGEALETIKAGGRVQRAGWNGKDMWICYVNPGNACYLGYDMLPCIAMKTADNLMQPGWLASQADMLSNDWCIVEHGAEK